MAKQISENAQNFLVKLLGTTAQAGDTVTKGVFKAYEGVMDAAATVGAAATQRLLPDVSKSFQAFAETDMYEEGKNDLVNNSLLPMNRFSETYKREVNGKTYKYGDGSVIDEGVLDDIKIPLAGITNNKINDVNLNDVLYQVSNMIPSVALFTGFGKIGSLGFLGLSAGGTAAEEAFKEGATAEQALAYGTASGLVEVGTEKMFDAFNLFGGGLLDKIIPSTTIAGRLAKGVAEEAFEEAVSEAVNPITRRIYDENSMSDTFGSKEGLKQYGADILNSAIMGGVTSLAMAPLGSGNIVYDVETKKTLTERARTMEANGKLTTEKATRLNEQIAKANANIETKLKKMNDADRAKTIAALKIKGFDADGTYTAKTYERAKYSTVGTELHNVQEIASKAGFETSTELTQDQEKVFKTVKKNLAKLQNKGLDTDGIVVVKENQANANQTFAGANADGVIFVNENRLNELNSALQTLAHESTHSLPMSFETLSLLDAVLNDEANGQAVRDVLNNYDVTQEEWDAAKAAFEKGTADAKQAKIVDETGAAFSENILGNEDAMRVLTRNNSGLVVKAYNSICDAIKLKQLTGAARSEYKLMLEYAAAFENAMTSEGIDFVPMSDDRDEENDENDVMYSHKGNGYDGYSMSNNARDAYADGEMPLSKWTKQSIIDAIAEINDNIDCSNINVETLKEKFLKQSSWHHTSMYYNATNFYSIKDEFVKGLTQADVDEIASNQKHTQNVERNKSVDSLVDEAYAKAKAIVEAGLVKTETGAVNKLLNNKSFDEAYNEAVSIIKARDENKVNQWRKLPADHFRQEYVSLFDNDIDAYIKKSYAGEKLSRNSNRFKEIQSHFLDSTQNDDIRYSVKKKAYTMDETESIIENVIGKLSTAENTMEVAKTARGIAASRLYQAINATNENRAGLVKGIADYLTDKMSVRNNDVSGANDAYVKSGQYEKDVAEFDILKADTRSIDVSEIKSELQEKYGANAKGILSRWAKNIATENPITVEQFMRDYGAQIHLQSITENSSDAEILNAMNERYVELQNKTEKYRPAKVTFQDKAERNRYALDMMNSILDEVDALGDRTVNVEEQYSERVAELLAEQETAAKIEKAEERAAFAQEELAKIQNNLTELSAKSQRTADLVHAIAKKADYLKGLTSRKYAEKYGIVVSALLYKNEEFRSLATEFSNIFNDKEGISPRKVRTRMSEFLNALASSQLFRDYMADIGNAGQETVDMMMENLAAMTEDLTEHMSEKGVFDQEPLTAHELTCMLEVLDFVTNIYTNYDTLVQDGQRKSLTDEAKRFETVHTVAEGLDRKRGGPVNWYNSRISSPLTVAEHMDAYQHGLMTDTVERITYDTWVKNANQLKLLRKLNDYIAEHKGYRRHLRKYVKVGNVEMRVGEFMDAYFMSTQENGELTLFGQDGGGLTFTGKDGIVLPDGVKFIKSDFDAAYNALDQTDKDFMALIWKVFQDGGEYKSATDIALHGFTTVKGDGNYYQLSRDQANMNSYAGDASKAASAQVEGVMNLKINKARKVQAKKIPLRATNILDKCYKYVNDVTNYNAYAMDISNFRRLYNFKLDGKTKTLRTKYDADWYGDKNKGGADAYISKLLDDVQGVTKNRSEISKKLSKFRGRFAQAQLGFNLNVILGQFASYPTALAYLDVDDLIYGLKGFFSKESRSIMDQYSALSQARNESLDIVSANTLAEVTSALGRVEGFLTGAMDRATLTCLFEATVHKFRKENPNMSVAEVYKNAAEYFDKTVVTRTQPTWQASDRSAWMREDSDVWKFVMAFRAVPLKQVSEFVSACDKVHVMKQLSKNGITDEQKAAGVKVDVKGAEKHLARVSVGLLAANAVYACMKQLVKHMLDKDDEDENDGNNTYQQIGNQFLLTTITMFPVFGDFLSTIAPGLGGGKLNNFDALSVSAIDEINDIADLINDAFDIFAIDRTQEEINYWHKRLAFKVSNFLGISSRNVWNLTTGLISQFSPSTGETIDSWFKKNKSYASKLAKAVENGDTKMINTLLQIQSGVDGLPSVYNSLIEKGYVDILPRSVGTSFTYDGEQYEMTQKERKAFQETYTGYAKVVSDMTKTVVFKTATDEVKAKAIKAIQNTYWQMAIDDTVGDATTAKLYVFSKAISIGKLAVITEACKAYSADKDDDGNTIAGSKKAKIMAYLRQSDLNQAQQAMVLAYLGYTDSSAKQRVKAYINSLNISKSEKEMLFRMCGY